MYVLAKELGETVVLFTKDKKNADYRDKCGIPIHVYHNLIKFPDKTYTYIYYLRQTRNSIYLH